MSGCECDIDIKDRAQSKVLYLLLVINATMFVAELGFGLLSESTALIADSLDMLADATVYGIALYAVGRPAMAKIHAATISGVFQVVLGTGVVVEVGRRLIVGSEPLSVFMMVIGLLALIANVVCLMLIARHKTGDVHMRASWIFSKNDVIANIGIIVGGGLVYLLDSGYPDLIIGVLIAIIVIRGGIQIIRDAGREKHRYQAGDG